MRTWWCSWTKWMDFSQGLCVVFLQLESGPFAHFFIVTWPCWLLHLPDKWSLPLPSSQMRLMPPGHVTCIHHSCHDSPLVSPASRMGEVGLTWSCSSPSNAVRCPRVHLRSLEIDRSRWAEPQAMGTNRELSWRMWGESLQSVWPEAAGGCRETLGEPQHRAGTSSLRPTWLQAQLDASIIGPGLAQAIGCCWAFPATPAQEENKHRP